jgi:hypothetical protein
MAHDFRRRCGKGTYHSAFRYGTLQLKAHMT